MFILTVSDKILTAVLFSTDSVTMNISYTALSSHNALACLHRPIFKLPQSFCSWALPSSSLLVCSFLSPANTGGQHILLLCSHHCLWVSFMPIWKFNLCILILISASTMLHKVTHSSSIRSVNSQRVMFLLFPEVLGGSLPSARKKHRASVVHMKVTWRTDPSEGWFLEHHKYPAII